MQLSLFLLQLTAAVMLLLYSTRMVRTGIERAMGVNLRNMFLRSRKGTVLNVLAGMLAAILLQSSTAVALLVSGFAATGVMGVTGSLAIVLGADLGTAAVVKFLSLNLSAIVPVLLAGGGILFLKFDSRTTKQAGRVLMGIAFILISLKMIGEATLPMRESRFLPAVVTYLSADPVTAFAGGALITFLFHSSVAAILLFATFCALGILPLAAGLSLVLGANAGGGLVAVWLTRNSHIKARRITLGNLIVRTTGALLALLAVRFADLPLDLLGSSAATQLVNFHLVFNASLVIAFLPLIVPMATLTKRLILENAEETGATRPVSALNREVLNQPSLAFASVTRELLRMAEQIEVMFKPLTDFFLVSNPAEAARIRAMDEEVNRLHTGIKLYIADLSQRDLTPEQAGRAAQLANFAIGLERAGDIVAKDILKLADTLHRERLSFSEDGWDELTRLHDRVCANIQLAMNVLVSEDLESARQLIREKENIRNMEQESNDRHLERLSHGEKDSIATSDIHLELVQAFKEINSRFVSFAYPVLTRHGELLESRLAQEGSTS